MSGAFPRQCKLLRRVTWLKIHFSHARKRGGIYFINTMRDKQRSGVSPDYSACIIGLLSMLSLIMNKRDMSNNPTHYIIDVLQQVVRDRSRINSSRNMHELSHPTKYSRGFTSHQAPHNANARKARLDGIEFIVMHVIISSAHIPASSTISNEPTIVWIFTSTTVRCSDYLAGNGESKRIQIWEEIYQYTHIHTYIHTHSFLVCMWNYNCSKFFLMFILIPFLPKKRKTLIHAKIYLLSYKITIHLVQHYVNYEYLLAIISTNIVDYCF